MFESRRREKGRCVSIFVSVLNTDYTIVLNSLLSHVVRGRPRGSML